MDDQKAHHEHLAVAAVRLCELLNVDPYETIADEYACDRLRPRWGAMMQIVEKSARALADTKPDGDEQRQIVSDRAKALLNRTNVDLSAAPEDNWTVSAFKDRQLIRETVAEIEHLTDDELLRFADKNPIPQKWYDWDEEHLF